MTINLISGSVTEKKLDAWLAQNRPELASYDDRGTKGFYRKDAGPAHGFQACGSSWRDVAARLGAVEAQGE